MGELDPYQIIIDGEKVFDPPMLDVLEERNKKLKPYFYRWKNTAWVFRVIFFLLWIPPVVFYGALFSGTNNRLEIESFERFAGYYMIIVLIFWISPAFPILYWMHLRKWQIKIVKFALSKKIGWKYDSSGQKNSWATGACLFPELFTIREGIIMKSGTLESDQKVYEQFWGEYNGVKFWSGMLYYSVETSNIINLNNHRTFNHFHFFVFKLKKSIKTRITLHSQTIERSISHAINLPDIDTEYEEFNRFFSVNYAEGAEKLDIITTLNPSVIKRLVDLVKTFGKCSILITENEIVFRFNGKLFKKLYTNFFTKGAKVDERDVFYLEKKMKAMVNISSEISEYVR